MPLLIRGQRIGPLQRRQVPLALLNEAQRFIPALLEFRGDQPVFGLHCMVLAINSIGFEPGLIQGKLALPSNRVHLLVTPSQGLQGRFDADRFQDFQKFLRNPWSTRSAPNEMH